VEKYPQKAEEDGSEHPSHILYNHFIEDEVIDSLGIHPDFEWTVNVLSINHSLEGLQEFDDLLLLLCLLVVPALVPLEWSTDTESSSHV
jgi:hypothetical protein